MKLLVGLGNPGPQYRSHRHNVGFMVLDRVHERALGSEWRDKYAGVASRAVVAGHELTLLKPQTFMNLSGRAVVRALQQMGLKLSDVLVVHDDLELPFGELRVKQGGGHAGHNGLRDIAATAGSDYARLRVGIGRPTQGAVDQWVLSGFGPSETPELSGVLDRAAELVEQVVGRGVEAMIAGAPKPAKGSGRPKR
ncbi:MAG: aminoacyl-tRNA hydrolase [Polyangiales bacterium]